MIDHVRQAFRRAIRAIAKPLDTLTGGKLTPNMVTWFGLAMHIPIAWLIAVQHNIWAAVLLAFFGLFDTLDGQLAQVQNRVTNNGGFLDATTDRLKEVILYTGIGYVLAGSSHPQTAAFAAAACGASICVSYVRAKGETILATLEKGKTYADLNKQFRAGLMPFEIRMVVLIVGLLSNQLLIATAAIAVLASIAALQRLVSISRVLR